MSVERVAVPVPDHSICQSVQQKAEDSYSKPRRASDGRNHIRIIPFCSTREHSLSNFDAKCFPDQHSPSYS